VRTLRGEHEVTAVNALAHAEAAAETGTNDGTASIVVARASFKRVRACRTRPRQGMWHTGSRGTRWGDADAGRPGLPSHSSCGKRVEKSLLCCIKAIISLLIKHMVKLL
jgi:hypothetical protein